MASRVDRRIGRPQQRVRGLYSWGSSEFGQLGLGPDVKERAVPSILSGFESTTQFAASGTYSIVLKNELDRTMVYAFGKTDGHSQGGLESPETGSVSAPPKIESEAGAEDAAQSPNTTASTSSIHADSSVSSHRLSVTSTKHRSSVSILLESLSDYRIAQVACGETHAAALTAQGKVFSWGRGENGQLGLGKDILEQVVPREVTEMDGVHIAQIDCGSHHTAMVTKSNALYTCGLNSHGQLGHGDFSDRFVPTRVVYLEDISVHRVSCGGYHTVVLTSKGKLYVWGSNEHHQLGYDDAVYDDPSLTSSLTNTSEDTTTTSSTYPSSWATPNKVPFFTDRAKSTHIRLVSCGLRHTCVLTKDGLVYIFGFGDQGELGLGPSVTRTQQPTLIEALLSLSIIRCYAASGYTAFVTDQGDLFVAGKAPGTVLDKSWQPRRFIGPSNDAFFHSVACGSLHMLALVDTGEMGRNRAIGRLVACERHYLGHLLLVLREITPVCETLVGKDIWRSIILNQHDMIKYHQKRILERLDAVMDAQSPGHFSVGSIFVEAFSDPAFMDLYTSYATDFSKAWERFLACLKSQTGLGTYLETRFRRDAFQIIPTLKSKHPEQFSYFLQLPTQHFAELAPLIEELIRMTPDTLPDNADLAKAETMCRQADSLIKGSLSGNAEYLGLLEFAKRFPLYQHILAPHRRFLLKSGFSPTEHGPTDHKAYVFNDLIMLSYADEVEHEIPVSDVFIKDILGGFRPSVLLVMPLQPLRLYVRSQKQLEKLIETIESAINDWVNQSTQHREHRSLIGIKMLTNNLEMIMPLLSRSYRGRQDSSSPRSPTEVPSSMLHASGISSMLSSLNDMVSRSYMALESDQLRRERFAVWGSLQQQLLHPAGSPSPRSSLSTTTLPVCEPFVVYLEVPGLLKEKKFSSFSKAFAKKRKKSGLVLTSMGATQAAILSGDIDAAYGPRRNYRIAARIGGNMTVGEVKQYLYKSAAASPWADSLQLRPEQEYVLRIKGMQYYLTNDRLTLAAVPIVQTILTVTRTTPLIELIALPRAGAGNSGGLPTLPNVKFNDPTAASSLFLPIQPQINVDSELKIFDEVSVLLGDIRPSLVPNNAEAHSFRHIAAGLRLQLQQERRQTEDPGAAAKGDRLPQYKGLEPMPSKLPTKLSLQINLPINNETHTLQVPPDVTIEFIHNAVFRFIYKHEKHKTREKITKFVKRMIEADIGHDSTSSDQEEEEEVTYVDTKEFTTSKLDVLHSTLVDLNPSSPAKSADAIGRTESASKLAPTQPTEGQPVAPHVEDDPSAVIELTDAKPTKRSRLEKLGLRASWKKEEEGEGPAAPERNSPSVHVDQSPLAGTAPEDKVGKKPVHMSPRPGEKTSSTTPSPTDEKSTTPAHTERKATRDFSSVPSTPSFKLTKDFSKDKDKDKEHKEKDKEHKDKVHKEHVREPSLPKDTAHSQAHSHSAHSLPSGEGDDSPRTTPHRKGSRGPLPRFFSSKEKDKERDIGSAEQDHDDAAAPSPSRAEVHALSASTTAASPLNNATSSTPAQTPAQAAANNMESSGFTDGAESDADEALGPAAQRLHLTKKEEEKLKKLQKEIGKKQKKEVERLRKEAKKAQKETIKKAKKEGEKARKEEKKKLKHLHNGKGADDFVLKVNGVNEFMLPGSTDDRPTLLCDYDYIRRAISNQTPIELRFVDKALVKRSVLAKSKLDVDDHVLDLAIARYPPPVPRFPNATVSSQPDDNEDDSSDDNLPKLALPNDIDNIEIYVADAEHGDSAVSRLDRPFWALRDDTTPFRIRLIDAQGLSMEQAHVRTTMLVVGIVAYGDTPFRVKAVSPVMPFDANPILNEEVQWPMKISDLPREARLALGVYGRMEYNNTKPRRLSSDVLLGWTNVMLFNEQGSLKYGIHGVKLWPGQVERVGTTSEPFQSGCATLYFEVCPVLASSSASMLGGSDSQPSTLRLKRKSVSTASSSYFTRETIVRTPSTSSPTVSVDETSLSVPVGPASPVPQGALTFKGSSKNISDKDKTTLADIAARDSLAEVTLEEGLLLLRFKSWVRVNKPEALPKLLKFVDWSDRDLVKSIHEDISKWPALPPLVALQLLDCKYPDTVVRAYAVNRCLSKMSDNDVYRILMQLIQALKYEPYHVSALSFFLLRRAFWDSRRIGHFLFWQLQSELVSSLYAERVSLMLEAFSKSVGQIQRGDFLAQRRVLAYLHQIGLEIKARRGSVASKTAKLHDRLTKTEWPERFNHPLDPRIECIGFDIEHCRVLGSKTVPLFLTFKTEEPLSEPLQMIYKIGDDLRQDALTLQMIILMDDLWKRDGLDLRLKPYACMPLGPDYGIIEVVRNASTTSNINIELGGLRAVLSHATLLKWLKKHNPTEKQLNKAIENFIYSCAGYSVITFVLGFADRHNDNIMLSKQGHLFHIDFGHFLGHYRKVLGKYVDKTDFVFIDQYEGVMGKENITRFEEICCQAYNILRKNASYFITLLSLMLASGLPELQTEADIHFMKERLQLHLTQEQAAEHFRQKLSESRENSTIQLNHTFHVIYQGIRS